MNPIPMTTRRRQTLLQGLLLVLLGVGAMPAVDLQVYDHTALGPIPSSFDIPWINRVQTFSATSGALLGSDSYELALTANPLTHWSRPYNQSGDPLRGGTEQFNIAFKGDGEFLVVDRKVMRIWRRDGAWWPIAANSLMQTEAIGVASSGYGCFGSAYGNGLLYVTTSTGKMVKITLGAPGVPTTEQVVPIGFPIGTQVFYGWGGMTFGDGALWLYERIGAGKLTPRLWRIDPATMSASPRNISFSGAPNVFPPGSGLAYHNGTIYLLDIARLYWFPATGGTWSGSMVLPWTSGLHTYSGTNYGYRSIGLAVAPTNTTPTVSIAAGVAANEQGPVNGTVVVTRSLAPPTPLTVQLNAPTGTALSGSDYQALPASVTIPAYSYSATLPIVPINDTVFEPTETIAVSLKAGTGYTVGAPSSATIDLLDNDKPTVTITASDATATEGGDTATFTIAVNPVQASPVNVSLKAPTGTAGSGVDYVALPTAVTVPANTASVAVTLTPIEGTTYEWSETVILGINSNAAYLLGSPSSATVTINDNDKPTVTITASDANATEGDNGADFVVSRGVSVAGPLTVKLAVPTGSATSGSDYQALPVSVVIPTNATSVSVHLTQINDTEAELPETVVLAVAADTAYLVGSPSSATATIHDNETPVISIAASDASAAEGVNNPGRFTLTRLGKRSAIMVQLATNAGTATSGLDFMAIPAVSMPSDTTTVDVAVTVIDDALAESAETVIATVSAGSGYVVGSPSSATVTIANTATPLPAPWASTDIGVVGSAGSGAYSATTQVFTVRGSGADITSTADGFHFVHRTLTGDGQIVARVLMHANGTGAAKIGVMMRESLTAGSRHAMMALTASSGARFAYRQNTDGSSGDAQRSGFAPPQWVKLTRSGTTFTGHVSPDGNTWTLVGSTTLTVGSSLSVGLAVTSRNQNALSVATFDQVSVTSASAVAALSVNFQPAAAPTVAGYAVDSGLVFGDRGAGQTYGWNLLTPETRDRNLGSDQLKDTFNHMQHTSNPTATWEVAVPDGRYQVLVVAGDASAFDSVYRINVEGVSAINGTPTTANRWLTGTVTVDVVDGRLTLTSAAGAVNNKVCYIEIIKVPVGSG